MKELIVLAPQLPMCGDHWVDAAEEVLALTRSLADADPARLYLTGFSFGGNGVLDLALAQPGVWAAAWAVDPTRVPLRDPGLPVWLSIGSAARRQKEAFLRILAATPDPSADRVWCDEGLDHVSTAAASYSDDRIYEWLLARRLEPA